LPIHDLYVVALVNVSDESQFERKKKKTETNVALVNVSDECRFEKIKIKRSKN